MSDVTIELVMARLGNGGKTLNLNNLGTDVLKLGIMEITQCIKDHLQLISTLELNHNQLKRVLFYFMQFEGIESPTLESLQMSYNELEGVHRITYARLIKLDVSWNRITGLLLASKAIQELNLEGNRIQKVDFLGNLKELKILNLGANNLEKVDFLIFNTQLEELNVRRNRITTFKGSFANTRLIRSLDASDNKISDISFIDNLPELQELNISNNSLSNLKFENTNENMYILDLSNNQLDDVRICEFKFPYLTHFYIQGNQIYAENSVTFLTMMTNIIEVTFHNNPFHTQEFEDKFIVDCPWLELVNNREVGKPGQYVKQEIITLKEKLQALDIDVNNFHLSDFDDGYVTEERLKAILRVQGFQDDQEEYEPEKDDDMMKEEDFCKFVTESYEQMDNIRAQYLRKMMKTQQSEASFEQIKPEPIQQQTPISSSSTPKQMIIRSVPKPKKQQSILSEISQLKQNMKSKEFYQSLGFNNNRQQRMNLSSENFNKSSEIRSSSSRPQLQSASVKLPKI